MRVPTRGGRGGGFLIAALLVAALVTGSGAPAGAVDGTQATPATTTPVAPAPLTTAPATSARATTAPATSPTATSPTEGLTPTAVRVGGVAGRTDAAGRAYRNAFAGAGAYFAEVNRHGGVAGRRIRLVANMGDGSDGARDVAAVRDLVERRSVFAVVPVATPAFAAGGYLAGNDVPAFGWSGGTAAASWGAGPTLFGASGSYHCLTCAQIPAAFVARQVGATHAAVIGGPGSEGGACVRGLQAALTRYGPPVAFVDAAGGAAADDAGKMHGLGVDFVGYCGDAGGAAALAQALRAAGTTNAHVFATDGYAPAVAKRLGTQLDGVVSAIGYLPVESAPASTGMQQFVAAMKRRRVVPDEQALSGWLGAELFVAGLRAAGPDPTRVSVVDALNRMTDFTADGILPGIDWSAGGHGPGRTTCSAYVEATDGRYEASFGQPGKPFVCFPQFPDPATLDAPTFK